MIISPEGKLFEKIRENFGALERLEIDDGDMLHFDFTNLYCEREGDIVKVDVALPSGVSQTIQRKNGKLVSFKDIPLNVEYRYEYGDYDVKSWWDRFVGADGEEVIVRGEWPGYKILCTLFTRDGSSYSTKIYVQVKYRKFDTSTDGFTIQDAQLADDGTVSYVMRGVEDALFAVQSGEWEGVSTEETRSIVKVDDYMTYTNDVLEDASSWSWKYDDESICEIQGVSISYEDGLVKMFISNEQMCNVNDIVLCYVNCSSNSISSGIYTEENINVTKLVQKGDGCYTFEDEYIKGVLSNGDPYRVRIRFGGFGGDVVYSKSLFVCEDINGKEEALRGFTVLEDSEIGSDEKRRYGKREFLVTINSDYLVLNIGKLRTSEENPQDFWIPKKSFQRRTAVEVLRDLYSTFNGGENKLTYISDNNKTEIKNILQKHKEYNKYWDFLKIQIGDDVRIIEKDSGFFEIFYEEDGELKKLESSYYLEDDNITNDTDDEEGASEVNTLTEEEREQFLLSMEGVKLVYCYEQKYNTRDLSDNTKNVKQYTQFVLTSTNVAVVGKEGSDCYEIVKWWYEFTMPLEGNVVIDIPEKSQLNKKTFAIQVTLKGESVLPEDVTKIQLKVNGGKEIVVDTNSVSISGNEDIQQTTCVFSIRGEEINDFSSKVVRVEVYFGENNKLSKDVVGISYKYKRPDILQLKCGCYDVLTPNNNLSYYRLNMYAYWYVENKEEVPIAYVELINGFNIVERYSYCHCYKTESFTNAAGEDMKRMYFFINFDVYETQYKEKYRLSVSLSDAFDLFERKAMSFVEQVELRDDYIVDKGYHPSFIGEPKFTNIIEQNEAFYYAWDMLRKVRMTDNLKTTDGHIYYEVLIDKAGHENLKRIDCDYITRFTIPQFCLSYQVKWKGSTMLKIGDYYYQVYHQTAKTPVAHHNTNTYYRRRVFRDVVDGVDYYRYDTVPIMITDKSKDDDFIPIVGSKESDVEFIHIPNQIIDIDDGTRVKLSFDEGKLHLADESFDNDFENLTFFMKKREGTNSCDLFWVSSEEIKLKGLVLIHDFNGYRSVRNITNRMTEQTKGDKTLLVGNVTLNYSSQGEGTRNIIVILTSQENKVTYLCWQVNVSAGTVEFFNSNSLEY